MQHYWSLEEVNIAQTWLTIGSFDGVHRGHQAILRKLVEDAHAAGCQAVVLTFFPHPAVVLRNREGPYYLTSPDERASLLSNSGVDIVVTHPFTKELSNLSAYDFLARVHRHLKPTRILVGHDFALGRNREGNVSLLKELGRDFNYTLEVFQPVQIDGEVISSSQIRTALVNGDVIKANELLGRFYQVAGRVVHGDGRGRVIGVPTANLDVWKAQILPKNGVYVCQVEIDHRTWGAVTNIGTRPTFEKQPEYPQVEAHILDLDKNLYGQEISLKFINRLRDERRFPNLEALVAQIQTDIETTRHTLSNP